MKGSMKGLTLCSLRQAKETVVRVYNKHGGGLLKCYERQGRSASEVEWSPEAWPTQAHAPVLSDAQVLGVLRDAAEAVCSPLASARVVAQGAQVCAHVRTCALDCHPH